MNGYMDKGEENPACHLSIKVRYEVYFFGGNIAWKYLTIASAFILWSCVLIIVVKKAGVFCYSLI